MGVSNCLPVGHPEALWAALIRSHGADKARQIAEANNTQAPFTLRANLLKTTRAALVAALNKRGLETELCAHPTAFNVLKRLALANDAAYLAGEVEVQDEASQIVASLVRPAPDSLVLDWCAGSGGKALAIAAVMVRCVCVCTCV